MFGRIATRLLHACALTSTLALASAGIAAPAYAQTTAYDGPWSVLITTSGGDCQSSIRYGVNISNGQIVNPAGGMVNVAGRVTPRGAVSVTVSAGNQWAVGSGRLGRLTGGGVWRGQGSSGICDGTWTAQRSGATAQATGAPLYNYAPRPASRPLAVAAPRVAACEARFRSYDPATGTYLGNDGLRHRCR
jgi:BA14K-like protein